MTDPIFSSEPDSHAVVIPMREIVFTLPRAMGSLNTMLRTHWSERARENRNLTQEVMAAIGGSRYFPRPPFRRARIFIIRLGLGMLDPDALPAAHKGLIDALCVPSGRHPLGLGIIVDDSARHIELVVHQRRTETTAMTWVRIEELPDLPPEPAKKRVAFLKSVRHAPRITARARKFGAAAQKP